MADCCVHNYGSYGHNENIPLGIISEYDGYYTVKVDLPGGSKKPIKLTVSAGDELEIPKMTLNENTLSRFQVFDQWGNVVPYVDEGYGITCENLSVSTYINQSLECDDNKCNSTNDSDGPDGYS